jgi:hypothetical protein
MMRSPPASRSSDLFDEIRFVDSLMHFRSAKALITVVLTLLVGVVEGVEYWLNLDKLFQVRRVLIQGIALGFAIEFVLRMVRAIANGLSGSTHGVGPIGRAADRFKTALLDRMALYGVMALFIMFAIMARNMSRGSVFEVPAETLMTLVFLSILVILAIDGAQSLFGTTDRTDDFLQRLAATIEAIKNRSTDPLTNED